MRRRWLLFSALVVLPVSVGLLSTIWNPGVSAANGLPELTAAEVRKVVPPQPGEDLFEQIPWQTSIWEARTLAAKQGKPILLWEMDGHPLGCG